VGERLGGFANEFLKPGLHQTLLTRRLEELLERNADGTLVPDLDDLRDAEVTGSASAAGQPDRRTCQKANQSHYESFLSSLSVEDA
jgi:hypothetical protein